MTAREVYGSRWADLPAAIRAGSNRENATFRILDFDEDRAIGHDSLDRFPLRSGPSLDWTAVPDASRVGFDDDESEIAHLSQILQTLGDPSSKAFIIWDSLDIPSVETTRHFVEGLLPDLVGQESVWLYFPEVGQIIEADFFGFVTWGSIPPPDLT